MARTGALVPHTWVRMEQEALDRLARVSKICVMASSKASASSIVNRSWLSSRCVWSAPPKSSPSSSLLLVLESAAPQHRVVHLEVRGQLLHWVRGLLRAV
ncbi:MAG: hypothetical protein H0U07_01560 [Actinobacteria bacterium]|nr:hypothetical protein [Actinomycetota bacterium]